MIAENIISSDENGLTVTYRINNFYRIVHSLHSQKVSAIKAKWKIHTSMVQFNVEYSTFSGSTNIVWINLQSVKIHWVYYMRWQYVLYGILTQSVKYENKMHCIHVCNACNTLNRTLLLLYSVYAPIQHWCLLYVLSCDLYTRIHAIYNSIKELIQAKMNKLNVVWT